jgi:membrane-associated phospholipid phosphatase
VALPPVGVPMLIVAAGVSWSRMQNNRHHPSDVLASIAMAFFFGVPLGIVVRRMRRAELQSRRIKTTTSVQLDLAPLNPWTT